MPDYKNMYRKLFKSVTQAIEILQQAQLDTEELYIDSSEVDENRIVNFRVVDGKEADNNT